MDTGETALDALIDASATWAGLTIDPAWRPAIRQSLVSLSIAIDAVESFPLPDEAEPATKFEP